MSSLPTREEARRICLDFGVSSTTIIVGAYTDGMLQTRQEFIDSLDDSHGGDMFAAICMGEVDAGDNSDAGAARLIIAAALGEQP